MQNIPPVIEVSGIDKEDLPNKKQSGLDTAKQLDSYMNGKQGFINVEDLDNDAVKSSRTVEMLINNSSSERSTLKSQVSVNMSAASDKMSVASAKMSIASAAKMSSKKPSPKHQVQDEEVAYVQSHFNLNKLTRLENQKVSQIMSHELISTITKTMNEANYSGIEGRIKEVVLQAIEKPVKKMAFMEDLLHKYADSTRKNVRRVHELEFIIEKFSKESNAIENFEKRFVGLEKQLKTNAIVYDEKIRELNVEIYENLPERFDKFDNEVQNMNRWFQQMQRSFDDIKIRATEDQTQVMAVVRGLAQDQLKNLEDIHKNQIQLDKDGSILKARINDQIDSLVNTESQIQLCNLQMNRLREDMNHDLGQLTTRIQQAEHDRMAKYYRQVSELQEDLQKHKPLIKDHQDMTESLAHHFCQDNINQTLNLISETLLGSLEGRQLNNFISFMSDRQDQIGKKKLIMLNNTKQDKLKISIRHLNMKQPFYPLPTKIPDDQLPPDMAQAMITMTQQMQQMQAQERAIINQPFVAPLPLPRERISGQVYPSNSSKYNRQMTSLVKKKQTRGLEESKSSDGKSSKLGMSRFRKTMKAKDFIKIDTEESSQNKQINVGAMENSDTEIIARKVNDTESAEQSSALKGTIQQNESQENSPQKKNAVDKMMDALQSRSVPKNKEKATIEAEKAISKSSSTKSIIKQSRPVSEVPPLSSSSNLNKKKNVITFADQPRHSIEIQQVPNTRMKSVPPIVRKSVVQPISTQNNARPSILKLTTQESQQQRNQTVQSGKSQDSAYHRGNLQMANPDTGNLSDRSLRAERHVTKIDNQKEMRELSADSSSLELSQQKSTRSRMVITSDKGKVKVRVDTVSKSKDKKKKKKKRQRSSSSSLDSDSGLITDSDCTSDGQRGGKFADKQRDKIIEVSQGLRVQWKEEDKLLYAIKNEVFSEVQQQQVKIEDAATRARQVQRQLMDHEKEVIMRNKQFTANISDHDLRFKKQATTIDQNFGTLRQYKKEIDNKLKDLESNYNQKMERQFQDFILKVDGELTRRNRNRIEFLARFEQNEQQIQMLQAQVRTFDSTQNRMLGSIKKLMYTNDIQTSLNIQDELDKQWVSLFGRIDERTGMHNVDSQKDPTDCNREKSHYTMNAQCMSCTGNNSIKMNLFKLACISYEANPVYYQGKSIARKELLSLQKVVSEMAKQSLEQPSNMLLKPLVYTRNSMQNLADTADDGPTLHDQSDATVAAGNQALQEFEENAGLSPERTQPGVVHPPDNIIVETRNNNQDINIQDMSNTANLTEQMNNQLTAFGEKQARNLLFDLDFQDEDLQQFSLIRTQQENIYQNIFKNNRHGNIISHRISSSNQKRSSIHKRRAHSQLSNFNTQAYLPGMLNDSANFNRGETSGGLQSFISDDHHSIDQQDAANQFNYLTQYTSRDKQTYDTGRSKMVLPTAVIQVGSQSFRDPLLGGQHKDNNGNISSNYDGNNFNVLVQGHSATTQMQQLKSRQLQPISSYAGGKKRTNFRISSHSVASKDQNHKRRPASVNQNSFNPHQQQLRSRKVSQNSNSSLMHNISQKINTNRAGVKSSLNKDQPSFIVASGDGQQNNQHHGTAIPTLANRKKKTSIMMSLVSSKNVTRMQSASKFETKESKDESSEQNKDFNMINHDDDKDEDRNDLSSRNNEKLIKVQLPQVFDYSAGHKNLQQE